MPRKQIEIIIRELIINKRKKTKVNKGSRKMVGKYFEIKSEDLSKSQTYV